MHKLIRTALIVLASAVPAFAGEGELPEVGVVTLKTGTVEITNQLNGRAVAYLTAEVRPQVNGIIKERLFAEGSNIEASAQLYQIDPAMYEAQLLSAEAVRARANANVDVANAKKVRYDDLLNGKAISQQEWDEVNAAYLQARAEVGIAEADVKLAQINLDYTKVFAPISGRIGKSGVTQGALVTANQTYPMATIQQLDPIYVDISQSTTNLLDLRKNLERGALTTGGESRGKVVLYLENGDRYPHEGKILFAEVTVDQSTGTVGLRTEFPNPDWGLLPGQYVRAVITLANRENAITVPQQSLMRNPDGTAMVYVVKDDGSVEKRVVTTLRSIGNSWLIEDGLAEGEKIVVEGVQRIRFVANGPPPNVRPVEMNDE